MRSSYFTFKGQTSLYVFVAVLFLVGVIFGALMVNALSLEQRQDLEAYLGNFFMTVQHSSQGTEHTAYWDIAMLHLKWVGLIFILGLSVVGLPGILVLDFLKGVLIGFTVGYLVGQYSWKGLLFALVSVAPHNLFVIPILLVCSVAAMTFSLYIIRNRVLMHRAPGRQRPFASYIILTVVMAVLLLGVASFETWVTPAMMRWVTPMLLPV